MLMERKMVGSSKANRSKTAGQKLYKGQAVLACRLSTPFDDLQVVYLEGRSMPTKQERPRWADSYRGKDQLLSVLVTWRDASWICIISLEGSSQDMTSTA